MMKKLSLLILLSLVVIAAQASVKLSGAIGGKYKIEMELVKSTASKEFGIRGRYNYVGKTQSLDLKGNLYGGNVLQLTESFAGKETGDFYLDYTSRDSMSGYWVAGEKSYTVKMKILSGDLSEMMPYDLDALHAKTNTSLTGTYGSETYFVNDYHYSAENPSVEVGYNGGVVVIKETGKGVIAFDFQMTCGPTYHMAYLSGEAQLIGKNTYRYAGNPGGEEDVCEIRFVFSDRSVSITQEGASMACGFGARAYADGEFMKLNNKALEGEDDISIQDVLKMQP